MIKAALVSTFLVCSAVAASANPGLTASLDIDLIQQAKDVYFDEILDIIRHVEVPDFTFDGGYVNGNSFQITENSDNVNFKSDAAKNALVFSVEDLKAEFKSAFFRYKELIFIATGSADVKISQFSVQVGVQMATQPGSAGRLLPAIAAVDVKVHIDAKHLDISLSGNIWTTLASWFEWFFESTICSQVESQLKTQLETTLPKLVNDAILASDGYVTPLAFDQMTQYLTVDFSTPNPVTITETSIQAAINGFIFDNQLEKKPVEGVEPIAMPMHDAKQPAKAQAFANTFFADNAFNAFLMENPDLGFTLDSSNTGFNMTTSSLNYALLGIQKHYGKDVPMSIDASIKAIEQVHIKESDETMEALSTINMKFFVHEADGNIDLAIDMDMYHIKTNFTVIVDDMSITGSVTAFHVEDIVTNSCSYGTVHTDLMLKLINDVFEEDTDVIPTINEYIANNFVFHLPDSFGGVFKLSDLTLGYHDDYLSLGATPTFIPPESFLLKHHQGHKHTLAEAQSVEELLTLQQ